MEPCTFFLCSASLHKQRDSMSCNLHIHKSLDPMQVSVTVAVIWGFYDFKYGPKPNIDAASPSLLQLLALDPSSWCRTSKWKQAHSGIRNVSSGKAIGIKVAPLDPNNNSLFELQRLNLEPQPGLGSLHGHSRQPEIFTSTKTTSGLTLTKNNLEL